MSRFGQPTRLNACARCGTLHCVHMVMKCTHIFKGTLSKGYSMLASHAWEGASI